MSKRGPRILKEAMMGDNLLVKEYGDVYIPSGYIMINDPLVMYEQDVLDKKITPGAYPLYLHIYEEFGDKRLASCELRFGPKSPKEFEEALIFDIESGTCGLMDGSIFEKLEALSEEEAEDMWNSMNKKLDYNWQYSLSLMDYKLDDINIVGFTSGYGKGTYKASWGYNEDNELCSLFLDFNIIGYNEQHVLKNKRYFDFGQTLDEGSWHCNKVDDDELPLDRIVGYNHLAVFLRWMSEHDMLSDYLLKYFPTLPKIIKYKKEDLRKVIDESSLFRGELCEQHFNEIGRKFALSFYQFNKHSTDYYPSCVDDWAETFLGSEKYHCEEYKDEAYLFVPYDEEYYQGLSKYIDKAWEKFNEK